MTTTINAATFNHVATTQGENLAKYEWRDKENLGQMENGEVYFAGQIIDINNAKHKGQLKKILVETKTAANSVLVFQASEATPKDRVYQKNNSTNQNLENIAIPSSDQVYETLKPYLETPSLSCEEKALAEKFMADLKSLGFEVKTDNANETISCTSSFVQGAGASQAQVGNVIAYLEGDPNLPSFHLSVHLDKTTPQGNPPRFSRNENIVVSDGSNILGADDNAGIAIILELIKIIKANKIPHGNIHISGLVAEEVGALGAQKIANQDLQGDIGLVYDGITSETVVVGGSDIYVWSLKVYGQTEHVAHASEVVNAETVACQIMGKAWDVDEKSAYHGDPSTIVVANSAQCGTQFTDENGDVKIQTSNSIPDIALRTGQIRTSVPNSEKSIIAKMKTELNELCEQSGAKCEFDYTLHLEGYADPSMPIIGLVKSGYSFAGLNEPEFISSHGGSNVNFTFDRRGGNILVMPIGAKKIHTPHESVDLEDMLRILKASVGIFVEASKYKLAPEKNKE